MQHIDPDRRDFYIDTLSQEPSNQHGRYSLILYSLEYALAAEASLAILHDFGMLAVGSDVEVAEAAVEEKEMRTPEV